MSSFEPDCRFMRATFRPLPTGRGASAAAFSALGASRSDADGLDADAERARAACRPEEHAELERQAFERGRAAAELDVARFARACEAFEAAGVAMAQASTRMLYAQREALLALSAEIARQWIGAELRIDAGKIAGPIERALELCPGAETARIRLHPEVFEALGDELVALRTRWSERLAVELEADARLEPAGFRIEAEPHAVGSGLDTLGERLRSALAEAFEAAAPARAAIDAATPDGLPATNPEAT